MIDEQEEVTVFAPATLANLSCGYDVLGLAIYGPGDRIIIRKDLTSSELTIKQITGDGGKLPLEADKNTAGIAALAVLQQLSLSGGFEMEIHKEMPFGSGLGSSAASAVGGAFAMNELLGAPLERSELLNAAMQGEQAASKAWHADNVAPGMLGGITLVRDNPSLDIVPLPAPHDLWLTVLYDPRIEILTADAREKVPKEISTHTATTQAGHLASFVAALYEEDFELIKRAMTDFIAEPGRKELIPSYSEFEERALNAGATAFGISGSGPSLYALAHGEIAAHNVASAFRNDPIEVYVSRVNKEGVIRLS